MFIRRRKNILHQIFPAQAFILILSQPMVRKQVNTLHAGQGIRKPCNFFNFLFRIIKGGNNRHPDNQLCLPALRDLTGIFQHQFIAFSRKFLMLPAVHMFDIHQILIQPGKKLVNSLHRSAGHAFHRRIDSGFLCRTQQRCRKIRLTQAFSSGKSEASSGTSVIRPILYHRFHYRPDRYILTDNLRLSLYHHGLYPVFLGLRVAAPPAPQNAAFQEYNGADPSAVMNGITLYVKNTAGCIKVIHFTFLSSCHQNPCSVLRMISSCRERDKVVKRAL